MKMKIIFLIAILWTSVISYADFRSDAGGIATQPATEDLDLNSFKILNLATPTADTDAANKSYVDGEVSGAGGATVELNNLSNVEINSPLLFGPAVSGVLKTKDNGSGNSENLTIGTGTATGTRGGLTLDALTTDIPEFGKYELSDLFGTSFGNQIPAFVIDGASAAAQSVFAGGIIYDGTGNESVFLIATKDIPAGAAEFSADLSIQVGSDASTGGGVGALQLIVNQHSGPSGNGGSMLLRVNESVNGTDGNFTIQADGDVQLRLRHGASIGQIGEYWQSTNTVGAGEWASLKGKFRTTDPCGDTTNFSESTIFYNDTSDYYCFCTGAGVDVQMHSPATACF